MSIWRAEARCTLRMHWGEILTRDSPRNAARLARSSMAFYRDTPKVLEQNWPVFSRGRFGHVDSAVRTQVLNYRCAVEVGGVAVEPGDLVFGDLDGVVIVPRKVEAAVIERAWRRRCAAKSWSARKSRPG